MTMQDVLGEAESRAAEEQEQPRVVQMLADSAKSGDAHFYPVRTRTFFASLSLSVRRLLSLRRLLSPLR